MGVYVFRSKHAPAIKVGHYCGEDAWARVARRGFYSCLRPACVRDRVSAEDLELLAWFPSLTPRDEGAAHRAFRAAHGLVGEWYADACADAVVTHLAHARRPAPATPLPNEAASCSLHGVLASWRSLGRCKAVPRRGRKAMAGKKAAATAAAATAGDASQAAAVAPKTVLSFDVGLRHLAYCAIRLSPDPAVRPEVLEWDVVDVTGPGKRTMDETTDALLDALDARFFEPGGRWYDHVLVENQPANKNPLMKSVQMLIYGYFQMLRRHAAGVGSVRLVSATRKLASATATATAATGATTSAATAAATAKPTYATRKAQAVAACREYLERHGAAAQLTQLAASRKKDDLSDCLLQATSWWEGVGRKAYNQEMQSTVAQP